MKRTTIDYGIDLGTTNSAIALVDGTDVEVIKNNEGFEFTPSVVWMDKKGQLHVGRRAKERLYNDKENAHGEFKLQMGTNAEYGFAHNQSRMRPEELSAEVLKALKADVFQRKGEDVRAAVITVPAAFELPQCDATRKAAELAGFLQSPLLQEPVAAAMAYGFQSESDNVFWFVFDYGGGTFDAAVIQVRDGAIEVVNHRGDNHLGGKLIDWEIVDQLLVPAVLQQYDLPEFHRGNKKYSGAFAKLKIAAEEAKIRLSRDQSVECAIEFLCVDERGNPVQLEYEMHRADVERLARSYITRAINLSKQALSEKRLKPGDVEKVLLVGGTTLIPLLREMVADPKEGLGIPLEWSIDPITVVARGSAIYAGSQLLQVKTPTQIAAGEYVLELDYSPTGPDREPLIGGKIKGSDNTNFEGYAIEFINRDSEPEWRSGKIKFGAEGGFVTTLWAEEGKKNAYHIEVCDPRGTKCKITPDTASYTMGLAASAPPLIHSIGVAMANNETDFFIEKGTPLPSRKRRIHKTAHEVRQGHTGDILRIPVVEGENRSRADRNRLIGYLDVHGKKIKRTIPAGSDVEITIEIDTSRIVHAQAYIPILNEMFQRVLDYEEEASDPTELEEDFNRQLRRLESCRDKANAVNSPEAEALLERIGNENMIHEVETSLKAASFDRDSADRCRNRLLDLKSILDQIEEVLEWPALEREAEDTIEDTHKIVTEYGNSSDRQEVQSLKQEIHEAMESGNPDLLRQKKSELDGVRIRVLQTQPGFWVGMLEHLETLKGTMSDRTQAEYLFTQGRRAIRNNDLPQLQDAVRGLFQLLPEERREGLGGGTIL